MRMIKSTISMAEAEIETMVLNEYPWDDTKILTVINSKPTIKYRILTRILSFLNFLEENFYKFKNKISKGD